MNASQPLRAEERIARTTPIPADPLRDLGCLLQLGRRARDALTIEALGFVMVNESRQLFEYRQGAWGRGNALSAKLPADILAVSGLPQPDIHAPYVQWLAQVMQELAVAGRTAAFTLCETAVSKALSREWTAWLPAQALVMPLRSAGGQDLGYLLLAREEPWSEREVALADELGSLYGYALSRFVRSASWSDRSRLAGWSKQHRWWVVAVLMAICLVPVRVTVLAPAEVVPAEPFLVRAPLEGVIDHFNVRPNQSVAVGDPLFDLDTTTLRAHSSVARKAYDVATEEYRQAAQKAVTDERSKVEMVKARGDLDEKGLEMEYSQQLLDRVQVKAARVGVAVFADAGDWQGRAVSIGERVLILADPARVELTVNLPVHDALDLEVGSEVTLFPNGSAFTSYRAILRSVAYRAEPAHDGLLAYRLKARFDAAGTTPRIGLMGMAKLRAGRAPLLYVLLRRPVAAARQWLGW